jgi:H+-translocating NAD(P) transhydrogenase subunit beta
MISHFIVGANDLMATFLVMSALAMLIVFLAMMFYAVSFSVVGMSLVIRTGWNLVGLFLSKLWMVSLLSMLALYNGIGGGAASAIATAEMFDNKMSGLTHSVVALTVALVGAASLSGSLIALTKLHGLVREPSLKWGRQAFPIVTVIVLAIGGYVALTANRSANQPIMALELICWLLGCALLFGALITLPFRRAQMPILISLYNGFTGLAIGLEGFILRNQALMIVGIMIGTARMFFTLLIVSDRGELKQT